MAVQVDSVQVDSASLSFLALFVCRVFQSGDVFQMLPAVPRVRMVRSAKTPLDLRQFREQRSGVSKLRLLLVYRPQVVHSSQRARVVLAEYLAASFQHILDERRGLSCSFLFPQHIRQAFESF